MSQCPRRSWHILNEFLGWEAVSSCHSGHSWFLMTCSAVGELKAVVAILRSLLQAELSRVSILQVWSEPEVVDAAAFEFQETNSFLEAGALQDPLSEASIARCIKTNQSNPACKLVHVHQHFNRNISLGGVPCTSRIPCTSPF